MKDRMKHVSNFTFDTRCKGTQLDAPFWAEETAKFNYNQFGDVVSFDATYSTNKYNMVFVPFTGIDNHKKSVTFGAGLLSREDADSYTWLLKKWLEAFGKQPIIITSDQDPAIKKAVAEALPLSHHRLCMWHVTSKLPNKVSDKLANNLEFKRRFNGLVWNAKLDEEQFELGWDMFLADYDLSDNVWLKLMFDKRREWIPAFFKNIPMSGLMRTTSLSESQNWSFQNSTLSSCNLVNFMITFDSCMERQRHTQSQNDFKTSNTHPKTITYLPFEQQANTVYTRRVFYQIQEEIFFSEKTCFQKNVISNDGMDTITILEKTKNISTRNTKDLRNAHSKQEYHHDAILFDSEFKVTHPVADDTFSCTCQHFEHVGLLCRHIFCVLKYYSYETIPEKYILNRWCRDVIPTNLLRIRYKDSKNAINTDKEVVDLFDTVDECYSILCHYPDKLQEYISEQQKLKSKYLGDGQLQLALTKDIKYQTMLGVTIPEVVDIENPSM